MPSLDDIEGDAVTDSDGGLSPHGEGLALLEVFVLALKFFSELLFHFEVSFVCSKGIAIIILLLSFSVIFFLLDDKAGTRLIGLRYFLTC